MRLLLFICLLFGIKSHEINVDKDYSERGTVVQSKVLFVPLGFDATINCDALDSLSSVHVDPERVHWRRLMSNGTEEVPRSVEGKPSKERFYSTSHKSLVVFGVQMVHNNTVVECHVEQEKEKPQEQFLNFEHNSHNSHHDINTTFTMNDSFAANGSFVIRPQRRASFLSRTKIVVQDCGEGDERKSRNPLNPCMYGVCLINNSTSFHRLECMCVEQYTGEYCDVQVSGTFWREFLFYSPVLAHLFFVALFAFHQCCVAKTRKVRRTALEDIMDKSFAGKIDMKKLYPAVYCDAADLEQMTQSEDDKDEEKLKMAALKKDN